MTGMLQVSLLGGRTIVDADTGQVRARSPRALALLGYLAIHAGVPQPRARLAGEFWPESSEQQALTNLRRELHQLRRVLDDDPALVVSPADIAWQDSPTCRVDVRDFRTERAHVEQASDPAESLRHGRAALASYGGDLLPGLYDDWVLSARDQLDRECADLCGLLVATARLAGDWSTALAAARRRVALQPLEETGYRDLIELQVELGDRAGALSTYHHCASVLERELGVQPLPATRAALDTVVPYPPLRRGSVSPAPALVGRSDEQALLEDASRQALDGATRLVLVQGEPGVGKTRLLLEATRPALESGACVARAQCYAGGGRLALAPVVEWLEEPALRKGLENLPPAWREEVERLLPSETNRARPEAPRPRGVGDTWQRHRFFRGLSQALLATGCPLVLVLDNLQWCDADTLDLIAFLTGEHEHGLLVLMAARTQALTGSPGHLEWLRQVRATGILTEISLLPFSPQGTAELAGLLNDCPLSEGAAAELHGATGGFPLYVVEAARAGALDPQPRSAAEVSSVLHARLGQLTPETREVAGLAAAVGRDFDLALLCEASDLTAEAVVHSLDELWRLRIVDEVRDAYDFSHDLLRTAAYDEVSPPRRWLLHRRLAQALELLNRGHTDEVAALLADQYFRAGNPQGAFEHYRRAAELATSVFAHAEAIRHNRAALELLPQLPGRADRDELEMHALRSLAASQNALHGYSNSSLAETWERLVVLAGELAETDTLVDSLIGLWATRFVQGRNQFAHSVAKRALDLSQDQRYDVTDRAALTGHAHFAYGGSALHQGNPREAVDHFEEGCETGEASLIIGSHPVVHARAWLAHAHWSLGEPTPAAACAEAAVTRARDLGHPYDLAIALSYAAVTWQLLAERDRLLRSADELATLTRRYRFAYYPEWGTILAGWASGGPEGTAQIRRGLAGLRNIGAFVRMPYWLTLLAETLDDDEQAAAVLDAALVTARAQADEWWLPELLRRRAQRSAAPAELTSAARTLGERLPS